MKIRHIALSALVALGGFPALSVVPGQFLAKDGVLLAAAVWLLGDALKRIRVRP